MQLPTVAAILSLAAFGAAQTTSSCVNGQYQCGFRDGHEAIYVCNGGQLFLSATCASQCRWINNLPYCI
ncbi:hypothetical protein C8A01DRAFT_34483 [Parachaetomium inaequale]|uniref:Sushi domain-containing protein n=1 Tax=Parachaetomium inaequale TaxID=2588326 RepID=A0AAN6PN42_9PEZI|nr:hypothetical protein C8A01DRAFT_34483 [Parachaetomium inaequale]